jgi:SPP1 family phage portal protein
MRTDIELTNKPVITVDTDRKLSAAEIKQIIDNYLSGSEIKYLQMYDSYYEADNIILKHKVKDKQHRNVTPNNFIPTAYYATITDTMAGYLFSNVDYLPMSPADDDYALELNYILEKNNFDIKEMKTGVNALAYNKGIELVYTIGDGLSSPDIRYAVIDPRQVILIYDRSIEPELFCAIRVTQGDDRFNIDVIYADEWQYYYYLDDKEELTEANPPKALYFDECPVCVYRANDMNLRSVYHKILPYINALDFLITGNSNDMERLADAILVLTKILQKEDLKNLNELKALMDVSPDDRAEYLQKNTDPTFREYASKLLIQEIHKHSHVIDWYSPDSGLSGNVSAKALRTRLFDMDMYSRRIEKPYKDGAEKRIRLITKLMAIVGLPVGDVDIVYNRTIPDDFEDKATVLNGLTFISDETKIERLGLDKEKEIERLQGQRNITVYEADDDLEIIPE